MFLQYHSHEWAKHELTVTSDRQIKVFTFDFNYEKKSPAFKSSHVNESVTVGRRYRRTSQKKKKTQHLWAQLSWH